MRSHTLVTCDYLNVNEDNRLEWSEQNGTGYSVPPGQGPLSAQEPPVVSSYHIGHVDGNIAVITQGLEG